MTGPVDDRLRMMHGGPFDRFMNHVNMKDRRRRAILLASLCWLVPVVLLLATGGRHPTILFMSDWGAWAKFLIAPILLTLAERPIGVAIDECLSGVFKVPMVTAGSMAEARRSLQTARERTIAPLPEMVCAAVAVIATLVNVVAFINSNPPAWAMYDGRLSSAGTWSLVVGNTIYWFLLTRLVWKHVVWWGFLNALGRCRLRLVVTHPDAHAGIGFVANYPAGYGLFTLAASSVFAAGLGHAMQRQEVTPALFSMVCASWLSVVAIYFAAPLATLGAQVSRLKRETIILSTKIAADFERAEERRMLGRNAVDDKAEDGACAEDVRDVKPLYLAALNTSALLLNKKNVIPALLPALLPLLVTGAAFLPYSELGPIVKRLLLL